MRHELRCHWFTCLLYCTLHASSRIKTLRVKPELCCPGCSLMCLVLWHLSVSSFSLVLDLILRCSMNGRSLRAQGLHGLQRCRDADPRGATCRPQSPSVASALVRCTIFVFSPLLSFIPYVYSTFRCLDVQTTRNRCSFSAATCRTGCSPGAEVPRGPSRPALRRCADSHTIKSQSGQFPNMYPALSGT